MEDSLEAYIKIVRNTKDGQTSQIGKEEELRQKELLTLQRKKECESRALKIVEFLIEGKLRPEVFLRCLKHINQSYYQDVVEERAISKLCGYSLCGNKIPEMPKQQYFIYTKYNKVYDVTDRKNYCSNFCYKASIHIKQQIDSSPLWLRKLQDEPKFNLLASTERGIVGEPVTQAIAKPAQSTEFTSVSSFTEVSLDEISVMEIGGRKNKRKSSKREKPQQSLHTVNEHDEISDADEEKEEEDSNNSSDKNKSGMDATTADEVPSSKTQNQNNSNVVSVKNKIKSNNSPTKSKCKTKRGPSKNVLENIKKYVLEWLTLETYIYLYGEARVKELLNDKQLEEYFEAVKLNESNTLLQRKYSEICRKLQLNQLAEEKFDRTIIGGNLKPVPDYKTLKEESKIMDLKVRSFYSGVAYDLKNESVKSKNETQNKENKIENEISEEGPPAVLPLVDLNSQTAMRRKIFLNSINKTMVTLTQNLGISSQHVVLEELQLLVKTFKLQAHSVVFKPALWNLIALILLKILSIRDPSLKTQLESKRSETFINLMLNYFPDAQTFLSDLFINIEDINLFLKQYFSEE